MSLTTENTLLEMFQVIEGLSVGPSHCGAIGATFGAIAESEQEVQVLIRRFHNMITNDKVLKNFIINVVRRKQTSLSCLEVAEMLNDNSPRMATIIKGFREEAVATKERREQAKAARERNAQATSVANPMADFYRQLNKLKIPKISKNPTPVVSKNPIEFDSWEDLLDEPVEVANDVTPASKAPVTSWEELDNSTQDVSVAIKSPCDSVQTLIESSKVDSAVHSFPSGKEVNEYGLSPDVLIQLSEVGSEHFFPLKSTW
jgi:hypothetical protein